MCPNATGAPKGSCPSTFVVELLYNYLGSVRNLISSRKVSLHSRTALASRDPPFATPGVCCTCVSFAIRRCFRLCGVPMSFCDMSTVVGARSDSSALLEIFDPFEQKTMHKPRKQLSLNNSKHAPQHLHNLPRPWSLPDFASTP